MYAMLVGEQKMNLIMKLVKPVGAALLVLFGSCATVFFQNANNATDLEYSWQYAEFSSETSEDTTIVDFNIFNNSKVVEEGVIIKFEAPYGPKVLANDAEVLIYKVSKDVVIEIPRLLPQKMQTFQIKIDGIFNIYSLLEMSVESSTTQGELKSYNSSKATIRYGYSVHTITDWVTRGFCVIIIVSIIAVFIENYMQKSKKKEEQASD
jgi:hypothetical protein